MRLIDADALKASLRHEYDKEYASFLNCKSDEDKSEFGAASFTWLRALVKLDFAATVDAVDVVRCKDCAKRHTAECLMEYECACGAQYSWESDDEFCSGGVRKTDDRR